MLRSRTDDWFECKIKYQKQQEDGTQKKVTEQYAVNALSFTEAEKRIMEEMSSYISGAFEVSDIKKARYKEVVFDDADSSDKWYKVKVQYITLDERTAKEKLSNVYYLVNASTSKVALNNTIEYLGQGMADFKIASVVETKILDVYEYGTNNNKEE
jgi:hypothetical protein